MISSRALIIAFGLLAVFILICARLFVIQVSNHDKYVSLAERQQTRSQTTKAQRGKIKDRNGDVLAYSKDDISFFVDTRMTNSAAKAKIAKQFSEVFDQDSSYFINLMNSKKGNVLLVKKASQEKALMMSGFNHESIFKTEDFTRVYPYGSLAAHVLGFTDHEYKGVAGIEKQYQEDLKGEGGKIYLEKDGKGRTISVNNELSKRRIDGRTVTLTINKNYQHILEEELKAGLDNVKAESAVGIIMDPNTGEILAMANQPTFDPMNVSVFSNEERRNRALTDPYEPGSTIKSIVMSILLDMDLAKPDEVIDTENGKMRLRGATIKDEHEFEFLTVREVLEQSSNIGMCKLSTRIEDGDLYKYLRDFGFGHEASIDLPGETEGTLKKPNNFLTLTKPFMSHGYEISVTPIQLVTAFCSVINGGNLMKPYVVKEIIDDNGKLVSNNQPQKIRQVLKGSTSELMKDFLVGVVENGTAKKAKLDNTLAGGKTGTAQRYIDGKYERKNYNASFIGFLPARAPNLVCYILLTHPKSGFFGGQVAAPIFRNICERLIEADHKLVPPENRREINREYTDQLVAQLNKSNKRIEKDEVVVLNPNKNEKNYIERNIKVSPNRKTMPNLMNLSKRDAIAMITSLGLKYRIIGSGNVVSQSIRAGEAIDKGAVLLIKCKPKKIKSLNIN